MASWPFGVARSFGHVPLELNFHAVFVHEVGIPVNGFTRIVGPFANKLAVHLAVRVVVEVVDDVHLVDLGALRGLELRVDCSKRRATHARARCGFFDKQRLRAIFCGACGGKVSRRAGADDDDLEIQRLNTVAIGDLGCFAKPIGGFVAIGSGGFFGAPLLRRARPRHACNGGESHGCRGARQKRTTIHFCSHSFPFPCAPEGANSLARGENGLEGGNRSRFEHVVSMRAAPHSRHLQHARQREGKHRPNAVFGAK